MQAEALLAKPRFAFTFAAMSLEYLCKRRYNVMWKKVLEA
jgi:hypothetical protein